MEFLVANEVSILRWLHIIAMVYWLGGEWGVFQTSYKIVNPALPQEERARHMDTAYRIDVMARMGIIALMPLGLHMGHIYGIQPYGGGWLVAVWGFYLATLVVTLAAFANRGTALGTTLANIEDWSRYIMIPFALLTAGASLLGHGPFEAGEGQKWYSAKLFTFGIMLCFGFYLRIVMREWRTFIPILAAGPNPEIEHKLDLSIKRSRILAYFYWIGIMTTAFFGAVKPF